MRNLIFITLLLFAALQAWPQTGDTVIPAGASDQPMVAPPPVNDGGESVAFAPEMERSNYLHAGVSFQGEYNDNIFISDPAVSDARYTISPTIAFDMTRSRLHWDLDYAPGFTFYQKYTDADQTDHVFSTGLEYRMSPHVTLSLHDNLAKTPSFSGLLSPNSGSTVVPSATVVLVPTLTDTLSNSDSGQVTYQFARGSMVGFGGNSSQMYFLGDATTGLFDSTVYGGKAFYTLRLGNKNYIGVNYQFQDLISHPVQETKMHSLSMFYTFNLGLHVSFSVFGGAQRADTQITGFPSSTGWYPTEGGSINWQGQRNSLALDVSRAIAPGGGLQGAVNSLSASVSSRHAITPHVTLGLRASYSTNDVLQTSGPAGISGHMLLFSGSLSRALGKHLSAELGYSRINQEYAVLSSNPDVNRGWVRIAYQFERPLGR